MSARQHMVRALLAAGLLVVCVAAVAYADGSVTARVDSDTVYVDQPFRLYITARGNRIGQPVIPHSDEIEFNRTPVQQVASSKIRIVNGRTEAVEERQWAFTGVPKRQGLLAIPQIMVKIDGTDYLTQEISLNAVQVSGQDPVTPPSSAGNPNEVTWDDTVLIDTQVDRRSVYVGERVQLTFRIWEISLPGIQVSPLTAGQHPVPPETPGFYASEVTYQVENEQRNGRPYRVHVYKRDLYPTVSGDLEIGSWNFECLVHARTVGRSLDRRRIPLKAAPVPIEVKPLPPAPPGFSGAVGQYRVQAALSQPQVRQGVPVELTLSVSGRGNLDSISAPPLPAMTWAQTRDPQSRVEPAAEPGGERTKVFSYVLTPLEPGEFSIDPLQFVFFDPVAQQFRTHSAGGYTLSVIAAGNTQLVTAGGKETTPRAVEILGDDLEPLVPATEGMRPWRPNTLPTLAGLAAPPLLFAGAWVLRRRQRRFSDDPAYARSYFARSRMLKALEEIPRAPAPAEALHHATTGYLGDKLHVNSAGMTSDDARTLLLERNLPEDLAEGFARLLRACERARYGANALSNEEVAALVAALQGNMDRLDVALQSRRASA